MSTTPTQNAINETQICCMALARMGSTIQITSLGQPNSNEAQQCSLFYPQDRDAMLADFPWPWAEGFAQLVQVAGPEIDGNPASAMWLRSYRYPSDCLVMRSILETPPSVSADAIPQTTGQTAVYTNTNQAWLRPVGNALPISYGESSDSVGRLVMSDFVGCGSGLTAVYTRAVNDPTQMTPDFTDALAWRLAADLAMGLGFDDKRRQYAEQKYEQVYKKARAAAMNAGTQSDSQFVTWNSAVIRARWGL